MLVDQFAELNKLNEAIDSILSELVTTEVTDENYAKLADQLTKLTKIKQIIVETKLKDFDAEEDVRQFKTNHALKNHELEMKNRESAYNFEMKKQELQQRKAEHEDTYALRKREIDLKQIDLEKPDRMSKDALVAAGTSIAGIILIIGYERFNVIASKAISFVLKR